MSQDAHRRIIVGGEDNNLARQFPMWGKGSTICYFAEKGLIIYYDESGIGERGSMMWTDAAERVLGLSAMVIKSSEDGCYHDERIKLQQFISDMESVIRHAKHQGGGPQFADERRDRVRRRATTVVMPLTISDFG